MIPRSLLSWYDANKRDAPWRRTRDPYAIWVSEVMLQQTQVATATPYYERWMKRFPNLETLARADEQEVLSLWQGLGYYRRARMLLAGAQKVSQDGWPRSAAEWRNVPGVGRYTASAIASICLDEASAVVDGNVERLFARFTGCELTGLRLHRAAWVWAQEQIDPSRPGDWNQAMMELGATVCRPREARCGACPIANACVARATGQQSELPHRSPRLNPKQIKQTVIIAIQDDRFGLEQIAPGEWWEGMWRFPAGSTTTAPIGLIRHTVTQHRISLEVHLGDHPIAGLTWFSRKELEDLPMPAPQRRALELVLSRFPET